MSLDSEGLEKEAMELSGAGGFAYRFDWLEASVSGLELELSRTRILSIAGGLISRAARLGDDDSSCADAILIRDSRLRAGRKPCAVRLPSRCWMMLKVPGGLPGHHRDLHPSSLPCWRPEMLLSSSAPGRSIWKSGGIGQVPRSPAFLRWSSFTTKRRILLWAGVGRVWFIVVRPEVRSGDVRAGFLQEPPGGFPDFTGWRQLACIRARRFLMITSPGSRGPWHTGAVVGCC